MDPVNESLRFYREHEYAVLRDFYPRSLIDDYRQHLQDALDTAVWPVFRQAGLDVEAADLGNRVARRVVSDAAIDPGVKQVLLGQFPLAVRLSDAILPIARHLAGSELLQAVCGSSSLFMHMPPMARFVPPGYSPAAVPPHQDLSYNSHMSDFVTVWTPLVEIDAQCGGLVVFAGSHRHRQAVGVETSGWLSAVDVGGYERRQLTGLGPGDAVLLSPRLVHGSAGNSSNRLRLSLDLRVFGATATSSKHHMNLSTLEIVAPGAGD